MIRAAALYIVIIISLMIAIISVSLLSVAFYYRLENQKKARLDKLTANLESGTSILLSSKYDLYDADLAKDLYEDQKDSVILAKIRWGAFDANTVKAFELMDTLKRSFLSGVVYKDSSAIYLADEDRPLSVSGKTQITGDGELPKSGLKQAYVDGEPYAGKELIKGKIKNSTRELPALEEKRITELLRYFNTDKGLAFSAKDSIVNSFFNPVKVYKIKGTVQRISELKMSGKVVLVSDTTVILDRDVILKDVLIYARAIVVEDGFKGSCQLFARDSIMMGEKCNFLYPSFAGVFKPDTSKIQAKIHLGKDSNFSGILFSYEKKRSDLQTMISIEKDCKINGEVFATGYIKIESPLTIYGKVSAKRFIMQRKSVLYENYLVDIILNRKLLDKYYLSAPLFGKSGQDNQVLRWLN